MVGIVPVDPQDPRAQHCLGEYVAELEVHAARSNPIVRLETNAALRGAIALYRSAGYVEVPPFNDEPYAQHWFEKRLQP